MAQENAKLTDRKNRHKLTILAEKLVAFIDDLMRAHNQLDAHSTAERFERVGAENARRSARRLVVAGDRGIGIGPCEVGENAKVWNVAWTLETIHLDVKLFEKQNAVAQNKKRT